ncbi:hypothetical protein IE81DRAFT_324923 [Ceraceosorus guamensis]|uniref:Protein FYV4, mitochondrial n=1 Tax=Ceraceosorus guamensis TaxID=1522189 RepID=A0A316VVX8_9BASI|nr:hypothetical protein IE81DRAFT_324923 [Ceraceosorus guamensis]PWN41098.1 hypothetical protein IE81DRAFT_324923 [Ceraceosorus guamensis]
MTYIPSSISRFPVPPLAIHTNPTMSDAIKARLKVLGRAAPISFVSNTNKRILPRIHPLDPREERIPRSLILQSSRLARSINPHTPLLPAALHRYVESEKGTGFEDGMEALFRSRRRALKETLFPKAPTPKEVERANAKRSGRSGDIAEKGERIGVKEFLSTIARPPAREDLSGNSKVVDALRERPVGVKKEDLQALEEGQDAPLVASASTKLLKDAGVATRMRKYIHWCLQRADSKSALAESIIEPKKPKMYRGWGPRVQNGKRVRGEKRPGEK